MTQVWNLSIPFWTVVTILFSIIIFVIGYSSTTVSPSTRPSKKYEYLTRIEFSHVLWSAIGAGAMEAIIFTKEVIKVPGNIILKWLMFLLIIGLIALMAFINMVISTFGTNMSINAQIREIDRQRAK